MKATKRAPKAKRKTAQPRCLPLAARGIATSQDFAAMMSALMADIIEERIDPRTSGAVCKAGSALLRVVEMQHKYGAQVAGKGDKVLQLAPSTEALPHKSEA